MRRIFAMVLLAAAMQGPWAHGRTVNSDDHYIDYNDHKNYDLSLLGGSFLPWGVVGVRDTYRMWGMRFSHPTPVARIEYGFFNANTKGVEYNIGTVAARVDYRMADVSDGYFSFGLDLHYYKRKASPTQDYPYYKAGGGFFGFGGFFDFNKNLAMRADFQFNWSPGKTFFAGAGLIYRFGGDNKTEP